MSITQSARANGFAQPPTSRTRASSSSRARTASRLAGSTELAVQVEVGVGGVLRREVLGAGAAGGGGAGGQRQRLAQRRGERSGIVAGEQPPQLRAAADDLAHPALV